MLTPIEFIPTTFEERGAAVPFTTPALTQARVRLDNREKLEVVLANLGGSKGSYVVGWSSLPSVITMTVHDRTLHEGVLEAKACTPVAIRRVALEIAKTGLAGPEVAAAARKTLGSEAEHRNMTGVLMSVLILTRLGISAAELASADIKGGDALEWAKLALEGSAVRLKTPPALLHERVAELTEILYPIGFPQAPEEGRLRRLLRELYELQRQLYTFGAEDISDAAPLGRFAAEVADTTLRLAEEVLAKADRLMAVLDQFFARWDRSLPELSRLVTRLCWLLDGWDFMIQSWAMVEGKQARDKRTALTDSFRFLPVVPTKEMANADTKAATQQKAFHKWVHSHQNWTTGEIDYDTVAAVESVKSKALQ